MAAQSGMANAWNALRMLETTIVKQAACADDTTFQKYAGDAKQNCAVSKALAGTEIHLTAKLA
jgi:organic hydroperoxide reductase OsmC/OhrA